MSVLEKRMDLHPLCHEHHLELKLAWFLLTTQGKRAQISAYHCPEPGCSVYYNSSQGYFILSRNGGHMEADSVPRVACEHDGTLLYLAEVQPERNHFRLWKCPQCNAPHTNPRLSRMLKPIVDAKGRITLWRCSDCAWTGPFHSESFDDVALWQAARKAFQEHVCNGLKDPAPQRLGPTLTKPPEPAA